VYEREREKEREREEREMGILRAPPGMQLASSPCVPILMLPGKSAENFSLNVKRSSSNSRRAFPGILEEV
jgi:hypothetical protein